MSTVDLLGWVGALLILSAYALLTLGKLKGNRPLYHLINLVGATLVAYDVFLKGSYGPGLPERRVVRHRPRRHPARPQELARPSTQPPASRVEHTIFVELLRQCRFFKIYSYRSGSYLESSNLPWVD